MVIEAFQDNYDKAILLTNDTDLIPAIKTIRSKFPKKSVGVLFPLKRSSHELKQACHFFLEIKPKHLIKAQFPEIITLQDGITLTQPSQWK